MAKIQFIRLQTFVLWPPELIRSYSDWIQVDQPTKSEEIPLNILRDPWDKEEKLCFCKRGIPKIPTFLFTLATAPAFVAAGLQRVLI